MSCCGCSDTCAPPAKRSKSLAAEEGAVLCLGNPLLDITASVDEKFLKKYDLKSGNAILADEKHKDLYKEMTDSMKVEYSAGGAGQNSVRVAQWMLKEHMPSGTSYIGCIGDDEFGKTLKKEAEKDGLKTCYKVTKEHPTGTCAVLVEDKERSMVANLGAANHYSLDHLKTDAKEFVDKAKIFYITGFHLTVSPDAVMHIAEHSAENNKTFIMNLAAPFIIEFFNEPLMKSLEYTDIVFANESEAATFGKVSKWDTTDLKEIARRLAALPHKGSSKTRTVIFTQGKDATIVAHRDAKTGEVEVMMVDVPLVKKEEIVDLNGAGDAFVGGFLAMRALNKCTDVCIAAGNYSAGVIIRRSGCTFPETNPEFKICC